MKKIVSLLLILLLVFTMAACSGSNEDTETNNSNSTEATSGQEEDEPLIGISVPQAPTGWVAAVQYYADEKAKELGMNFKIVASADPNEQASQIDDLINMDPEIIVLFPHNDQVAVAAQKIKDAGITLINFDRTIHPTEPDYYLAGDNYGMGVEGAKYIAEKLGGEGKLIVASIASWGEINNERIEGFMDTIPEVAPDIEVLGTYDSANGAPESGLSTMTDALQANPEIDAVFSVDDELSVGLYQAIQEQDRTDIKVLTGGGGAQSYFNIMSDTPDDVWLASALYSPNMIIDCLEVADSILKGDAPESNTIIIPSKIVDKINVDEYLDSSSPY